MPKKILIVDDNPDDIEVTKIALEVIRWRDKVEAVMRGEFALELLREGKDLPSLILLDLKMPGLSGVETLRQIRGDSRLKHIPVIIVTSSSLESDREDAYNAGASSYLHKTFDIDQFSRDLNSLMERYLTN